MKKQIITIAFILFANCLQAQESKLAFFQVENSNYLHLEQFKPNSILETYSTPQGGVKLGEIEINVEGKAQQMFDLKQTPAFVLNRKSTMNPSGNNHVQHLKEKEFTTKEIHLSIIGNEAAINWEAQIPTGNDIEFRIQKSVHGNLFTTIHTIKGNMGNEFNKYSYTEDYDKQAIYVLQIVSGDKEVRYTSKDLTISKAPPSIVVYPTLFTNQISIILPNTFEPATYLLCDMNGKMIRKGNLKEASQMIDHLDFLPIGNYIIQVGQGIQKETFKLLKE